MRDRSHGLAALIVRDAPAATQRERWPGGADDLRLGGNTRPIAAEFRPRVGVVR
ncbi:hypothetical protein [Nocardia sp. R6R-6]|uniref:hypothetical protein n=1 Tax=Nocardia sp. R6R-6 TaxID=3459303 RepID=UPI00403DA6CD